MMFQPVCIVAPKINIQPEQDHRKDVDLKSYIVQILLDSLGRGEFPYFFDPSWSFFSADGLTTEQRNRCLLASVSRSPLTDKTIIYNDFGVNEDMKREILRSEYHQANIEYRRLNAHAKKIVPRAR